MTFLDNLCSGRGRGFLECDRLTHPKLHDRNRCHERRQSSSSRCTCHRMLDTGVRQRMAERGCKRAWIARQPESPDLFYPAIAHFFRPQVQQLGAARYPANTFRSRTFCGNHVFPFEPVEDAMCQTHGYSGFVGQIVDSPEPFRSEQQGLDRNPGLPREPHRCLGAVTWRTFSLPFRPEKHSGELHVHVPQAIDDGHACTLKDLPSFRRCGPGDQQQPGVLGKVPCVHGELPRGGRVGLRLRLQLHYVGDATSTDNKVGPSSTGRGFSHADLGNVVEDSQRLLLERSLNIHYWFLIHSDCEYAINCEHAQGQSRAPPPALDARDQPRRLRSWHEMTDDPAFHFPPDVFGALVDAIPLLTRSKKDVLTFFHGCGVKKQFLAQLATRVDADPAFSKYHIAREVLIQLNERGDAGLAARRQVIKRVSEFEEYSSCYPDNQLKAQGAVAAVRQLVNKKDSFTRMQLAHEEEQRQHAELQEAAAKRAAVDAVKSDLFKLFGETDPQRRGKALEGVLNRLFQTADILIREAFVVTTPEAGVIEQIDGVVEIDGRVYVVEMKWWDKPLGRAEVATHLVSVYGRGDAGGVFISASGYHDSAFEDYKTALSQHTVVLVELEEIVALLDSHGSLKELLRSKIREATLTKRPLFHPPANR